MEDGHWYVAKLVMRGQVDDDTSGPWTCDEQVRLIRAMTDEQAYEKALRLGREEEHNYENASGEPVTWSFLGLSNLHGLLSDTIEDGTEITNHITEESEPMTLVRSKEHLAVFWMQRNRHRPVSEIIGAPNS